MLSVPAKDVDTEESDIVLFGGNAMSTPAPVHFSSVCNLLALSTIIPKEASLFSQVSPQIDQVNNEGELEHCLPAESGHPQVDEASPASILTGEFDLVKIFRLSPSPPEGLAKFGHFSHTVQDSQGELPGHAALNKASLHGQITVINDSAFVGVETIMYSLQDFDFAPNLAPTFAQEYPQLSTETVLVASGGDSPLIDPAYDWIVDSGCTSHMCCNKDLFTELQPYSTQITTAGEPTLVSGIGTAKIRAELDEGITNFSLLNTLLVASLPVNLISQSKLDAKFYMSTRHGFQVRSRDTDQLVFEARLVGGLYVVRQERILATALLAKPTLLLWHERLGHINVRRLLLMKEGVVEGVDFSKEDLREFFCEACALGKAHRLPIRKYEKTRCTVPGERISWDITGPMPKSYSGNTYLIVGVCDATGFIWTGFYPDKATAPQHIDNTIELVERQRGKGTVKGIHSDGGAELISNERKARLKARGIECTWTSRGTPEHNRAERTIQTIVSSGRCMLINAGIDIKFWPDACRVATIVQNASPIKCNKNVSAIERWTKRRPDVANIRTFGCKVLVKEPEKVGKFAIRTWDGINLGPAEGKDGHKIWNPATKRVNVSRDVYFLEGRGRPAFHKSPLIEKVSATENPESDGDSEEDDEDYRPFFFSTAAGRKKKHREELPNYTNDDDEEGSNNAGPSGISGSIPSPGYSDGSDGQSDFSSPNNSRSTSSAHSATPHQARNQKATRTTSR